MTSADTPAASFEPSLAEPNGSSWRRLVLPFALGIARFSAFRAFVVLTGLPPIDLTRDVLQSFLLINAATILLLVGIILREIYQIVQAFLLGRAAPRVHVPFASLPSVLS